ncbi:MAG: exopolyphosphatase [Candidatus Marinimicrobia bacterium]|nr:exopolyphosphatase [Candidatus Neomarinimicrobiota bacterium]MCF7905076.1 exopolyphosphatase [Candidatus Neomarinimicrobiota bacterium]
MAKRHSNGHWSPDSEYRYAAIDIGSNGVRLLLSKVISNGDYIVFTKESLVRMPIRLGADVFQTGTISQKLENKLVSSLTGFSHLVKAYDPVTYRACATSAMREAENGSTICKRIKRECDVDIKIISGGEEAEIIFASHIAENLNPKHAYLYIDVGGGSTELTVFAKNERVASRSFPIGTVRMLNGQVSKELWRSMKQWVTSHLPAVANISAIGSGGNMNKIYRLAGKKSGEPITFENMIKIDEMLNAHDLEERIRVLNLRPDRADVILPASKIFTTIMKWGKISRIHVPQFGLADGLIHMMHEEYAAN